MDLTALREKKAKIKLTFDGEEVNCEFLPNKITPEYWARLQGLSTAEATEEETGNRDVVFLADTMPWWDITAGGEALPPTRENLRLCPNSLLAAIVGEILDYVGKQAVPSSASD